MAVERIRITPDYIIAKNSAGIITYSAGTVPATGTEFPSYLRSTETSDTINVNSGYDIYYNQLAPIPYPINNISGIPTTQPGGSIFSITQIPVITANADIFNFTLTEPGIYTIVPTLWFTQSGSPQNYKNTTAYATKTGGLAYISTTFNGILGGFYLVSYQFSDGSTGWFGPCNPTDGFGGGGDLISVSFNYGMDNPDSTNLNVPASYSTTYTTPVLKVSFTASDLSSAGISSNWTRGIIKVLYYSRGYLKLRYTK